MKKCALATLQSITPAHPSPMQRVDALQYATVQLPKLPNDKQPLHIAAMLRGACFV
jgi:hypothetical protein